MQVYRDLLLIFASKYFGSLVFTLKQKMSVITIETRKLSHPVILKTEDLARIHDASVRVLEETGMVFHSDKVLALLKKHGARVSGKTARVTRSMIDEALDLCPENVKWRARNEDYSIVVGKGPHVQASGGSVYIQDIEKGRRPGTLADFTNIQKLYQSSDVIDVVGFTPVDAGDIETNYKHLHMQYEILKNTNKPIHGHVCGGKQAGQMLDMTEIAFAEEGLMRKHHVMGTSINTISPLGFGEEQLETLLEYVSRNQIIIAAPMALGGMSAPASYLGMTVLVNAEILAMIVLIQLINPGNPVITGPSSSYVDMKTGEYSSGTPDGMIHMITHIQLSRDFYHLPTRVLSGACESKVVDVQAGFETMQNLMASVLVGSDLIAHACGILDNLMTISYEKLIIDEELIHRAFYMAGCPVEISEDALSVDIINEIGSGGSYLQHQSTFNKCRTLFQPTVANWSNYEEWARNGSQDIVARANGIYKERLAAAPESFLDSNIEGELKHFMKRIINGN